ncbi:MAG: adenosine deaminase, partial [Rhodospirillaceae bacterium]|nr:adenosine deaminase [Rhodospirillaceae bacterium]
MAEPDDFIAAVPKAELHLHIEGTLGPALRVALARRNGLPVPDVDPDADTQGYDYASLEEFLGIYYEGMDVLRT